MDALYFQKKIIIVLIALHIMHYKNKMPTYEKIN